MGKTGIIPAFFSTDDFCNGTGLVEYEFFLKKTGYSLFNKEARKVGLIYL